jgi:hypothetical protein
MSLAAALAHPLPHPLPDGAGARLALFAIRRLGAHGLHDAHVSARFVAAFGPGFRRPLVLTRAFMQELAATAGQPVAIAPCCCQRATSSEATLLTVLARAASAPCSAWTLLADQLDTRDVGGSLACAGAVAAAFADAGLPIG